MGVMIQFFKLLEMSQPELKCKQDHLPKSIVQILFQINEGEREKERERKRKEVRRTERQWQRQIH